MSGTGRILAAVSGAALVLGLALQAAIVSADTNNPAPWHAHYFTENVEFKAGIPGDSFQFVVQYTNGGSASWVKGAANQEARLGTGWTFGDLFSPSDNTGDFNAGWSLNWSSPNRIAGQTESTVLPGTNVTFTYNAKIPTTAANGKKMIKAQPVIDGVAWLENYGYYQGFDVSGSVVATPTPTLPPSGIAPAGNNPVVASVGTPNGTARLTVCFNHSMATTDGFAVNDISHYSLAGTGATITGVSVNDSLCPVLVLSSGLTKDQTYSLTVTDVADSSGFMLTPNPTTLAFTATDNVKPTALSISQPGTYSLLVRFSEAIDPATATVGAFRVDGAFWPGGASNITVNSGNTTFGGMTTTGITLIDPNTEVRLDWLASAPPGVGTHNLDVKPVKDAAGNALATDPTSFSFSIVSDVTVPFVSAATGFQSSRQAGSVGTYSQYVNVDFSEGMATTTGPGYATSIADAPNYTLFNSAGTGPALAGCTTGATLTVSSVAISGEEESRFELKRARLRLSGLATAACTYMLKITTVRDQAGNSIVPSGLTTYNVNFSVTPDTTLPTVSAAKATPTKLLVVWSKDMYNSASATTGSNYTSTNSTLQGKLTGLTPALNVNSDGTTVIFSFAPPALPSGTYPLTITGVQDPAGNTATTVTVTTTFQDTQPPTISTATWISTASFSVTFSKPIQAAGSASNSALNSANYSVNNRAYGSVCTGSLDIVADSTGTIFTLTCTSGTGFWPIAGSNVIQVRNVADFANNVLYPNPASKGF